MAKYDDEPRKARGRKGVQYERQFTSDEKEMLISLWHGRPLLWDSAMPEYLDIDKKQLAIKEISQAMNIDVNVITKQMKSLKSYYCSLRQSHDVAAITSGSCAADAKKPVWPYYELLKFLDENITRGTNSNMKRNQKLTETHTLAKSARRLVNHRQGSVTDGDSIKDGYYYTDNQEYISVETKDEDDIFGELIAKSLKKIDDCVEKEELKIQIQTFILETKKQLIT